MIISRVPPTPFPIYWDYQTDFHMSDYSGKAS